MTKFATIATELSYPPLEGEGRSLRRSEASSLRSGWGDCSSAAYPSGFGRLAPHPVAQRRSCASSQRADPPPPGEGKKVLPPSLVFICSRRAPRPDDISGADRVRRQHRVLERDRIGM